MSLLEQLFSYAIHLNHSSPTPPQPTQTLITQSAHSAPHPQLYRFTVSVLQLQHRRGEELGLHVSTRPEPTTDPSTLILSIPNWGTHPIKGHLHAQIQNARHHLLAQIHTLCLTHETCSMQLGKQIPLPNPKSRSRQTQWVNMHLDIHLSASQLGPHSYQVHLNAHNQLPIAGANLVFHDNALDNYFTIQPHHTLLAGISRLERSWIQHQHHGILSHIPILRYLNSDHEEQGLEDIICLMVRLDPTK